MPSGQTRSSRGRRAVPPSVSEAEKSLLEAMAMVHTLINGSDCTDAAPLKVGDRVRVRPGVIPSLGWGNVRSTSVGRVVRMDGERCDVDFPGHNNWHGKVPEIERVIDDPVGLLQRTLEAAESCGTVAASVLLEARSKLVAVQRAMVETPLLDAIELRRRTALEALTLAESNAVGDGLEVAIRQARQAKVAGRSPAFDVALRGGRNALDEAEAEAKRRAERCAVGAPAELSEMPGEFKCAITLEVMRDPVVAADGYTYERNAIERHLSESRRSPMTNEEMAHSRVMSSTTQLRNDAAAPPALLGENVPSAPAETGLIRQPPADGDENAARSHDARAGKKRKRYLERSQALDAGTDAEEAASSAAPKTAPRRSGAVLGTDAEEAASTAAAAAVAAASAGSIRCSDEIDEPRCSDESIRPRAPRERSATCGRRAEMSTTGATRRDEHQTSGAPR
eukprot:jgi/Chrpa1/14593/Chrysochromulina_OHIO_Genome00007515-RA